MKMNWALLLDMAVDGSGTQSPTPNQPIPEPATAHPGGLGENGHIRPWSSICDIGRLRGFDR
ncbi:MAG: hypothetical protein ABIY48_06425, partial [Acidimicrobiales bacterium]